MLGLAITGIRNRDGRTQKNWLRISSISKTRKSENWVSKKWVPGQSLSESVPISAMLQRWAEKF